jgi:eukaryotic-like serine/threonine-protein kinase
MTSERWHQVCAVFDKAVGLAPAEREVWLHAACALDAELRAEVDRLIDHDAMAIDGQFLARRVNLITPPRVDQSAPRVSGERWGERQVICPHCRSPIDFVHQNTVDDVICPICGSSFRLERESTTPWSTRNGRRRLGRFDLLDTLGVGTFGTVYKAYDPQLDRIIALKVPRVGTLLTEAERTRFLREGRSMAQLHHRSIVTVHDVGQIEDVPYMAMELIQGLTLSDRLTAGDLTARESAELIAEVADALSYAHERSVIHRDMKPSNIIIDAERRPHVTDFGLAKRRAGEVTMTLDGQVLGTPAYMSPEQARGEANTVDGRSDVYSMGAILYELLTGELPFRGNVRMILHQVLNDEPKTPRALNDHVPRSLETICQKAMAKDPAGRYATAHELAADLRRFLAGIPIKARPVGVSTRLLMWAKRNPRVAALSAAVFVLLAIVTLGSVFATMSIQQALQKANDHLMRQYFQNGVRLVEEGNVSAALPWFVESMKLDRTDSGRQEIHGIRLASLLRESPRPIHTWTLGEQMEMACFSPNGKSVLAVGETRGQIWNAETGKSMMPALSLVSRDKSVLKGRCQGCFSLDGRRVLTVAGSEARVWDAAAGTLVRGPMVHDEVVKSAALSPDGHSIAAASGSKAFVWGVDDVREHASPLELRHPDLVNHVAFSPDGRRLVVAYGGPTQGKGEAWVWDVENLRKPLFSLHHNDDVYHASFSADGSRIITASYDQTARIWDAKTGQAVREPLLHSNPVTHVGFSPDGLLILTVSGTDAQIWDLKLAANVATRLKHRGTVLHASFSPDGNYAVTSGLDQITRVWDVKSGDLILPPIHHDNKINHAAFSPDGRFLITVSSDQTARMWDLARGTYPLHSLAHGDENSALKRRVVHAAFSMDGERIVSISADGACKVWDASSGRPIAATVRHGARARRAAFSPSGNFVVTAGDDGVARVWDVRQEKPVPIPFHHDGVIFLAGFSPDSAGERLFTVTSEDVRIWNRRSRDLLFSPISHGTGVSINFATFSPDGRYLTTAGADGIARIWSALDGRHTADLKGHTDAVCFVAYDLAGRRIVTTSSDRTARIWDVASLTTLAELKHKSQVNHAAFSPDGRLIATASSDRTARIWKTSGEYFSPSLNHKEPVLKVCFGSDGRLLATASGGLDGFSLGEANIWEASTGQVVTRPIRHGSAIHSLAFNSTARLLLTASGSDPSAKVWTLTRLDRSVPELQTIAEVFAGTRIDPVDGQVHVAPDDLCQGQMSLHAASLRDVCFPRENLLAWIEANARFNLQRGEWKRAIASCDSLIESRPWDEFLLAKRANAHAQLGNLALAANDFALAIKFGSPDEDVWFRSALLLLCSGDLPGYRSFCEHLIEQFGTSTVSDLPNNLAYVCTLGQNAKPIPGRVVAIVDGLVAADPTNYAYLNTLGIAHYRAEQYSDAIARLVLAIKFHRDGVAIEEWFFLAMAFRRLGRIEDARCWLEKAENALKARSSLPASNRPEGWPDAMRLKILAAEAAELFRQREPPRRTVPS